MHSVYSPAGYSSAVDVRIVVHRCIGLHLVRKSFIVIERLGTNCMVSGEQRPLRTNGWAERTLLNCLAITQDGGIRSDAAGMQDVHPQLMEVAKKPDNEAPDDESVYMTGNRAFHQLHEKGLVENVEEVEGLSDDRYVVEPGYAPQDARRTEWVLTEAGIEEVRRLSAKYEEELATLMRRFGRWNPASLEGDTR